MNCHLIANFQIDHCFWQISWRGKLIYNQQYNTIHSRPKQNRYHQSCAAITLVKCTLLVKRFV